MISVHCVWHDTSGMKEDRIRQLGLIAGKGAYPRVLAESARKQGVERLYAIAFKKETDPVIERYVDQVDWISIGQMSAMLDALKASGMRHAVMAGQITPTHLFRIRPDKRMLGLLARLKQRNAETIFGAIADELKTAGVELMPASLFMQSTMPGPGRLGGRSLAEVQREDVSLGLRVAKTTSGLDIGQTVVIKDGTVLAVEAFEGTDETILRGGKMGGAGAVVVKVAKPGHDMRFDIPVVGERTMKTLGKIKAAVLAVEAERTILLEREKLVGMADAQGLVFVAVDVAAGV